MRLTILELPATWGTPARVLDEVDARLAAGPATDLVVLPEASIAGYVSPAGDFDVARFAESLTGPTARRCGELARAHHALLVAPLVLREDAAIYNAMAGFDPRGELAFVYRKRHPWIPETWATPGPQPAPLITLHGRQITIAICYDLHFLVDDSADLLAAADLLLFPSAWVEDPDYRAARLVRLARRFDLVIANANWAPGVVEIAGQGGSCVVDPTGVVARAPLAGRLDVEL
ncbi:MAG: carbon-nitrogen hydrolase family protein [Proteobacteria bacterium]|nr:carbon-nitrogen hydrolase family protein [Pseudomonadota bacterium]